MNASLESKALGIALLAATLALGGAFAAAAPIKWLLHSPAGMVEVTPPAPDAGPGPDVSNASPALVEQGHQFFTMSCVECHGDDAHGDEGPDLHNLTISNARIAATIRHGVKGEMPTFARKYNDAQLTALVAYLRSLR